MDFLKDNWFILLVAVVIISFVAYFVYDQNKDNVTVKKVNGQDVIATLTDTNITAEDLYEKGEPFDASILYYMYRNAVIDQAVETTDELKEQAETTESTIISSAKYSYEDYELVLTKELANYGFSKFDDLYQYCLVSTKESVLDEEYVKNHYDDLKDSLTDVKPRLVSVITMAVADPENLTDEEKAKQENIDKALESDTFAKAATAFSEDTSTADKEGFLGYVDSNSTNLDSTVLAAVLELDKDGTTDWIQVTDSSTGAVTLYKAHVDETDLDTIYGSDDETVQSAVISAFITANPALKTDAIEEAASKLNIEFASDDVKEKVEAQIAAARGE